MSEPRTNPELDSILAACLDDLLSGRVTLSVCLATYPQYADELKPLLQTAILAKRLKSPEMSASAVDSLEMRLRTEMQTNRPIPLDADNTLSVIGGVRSARRLPLGLSRLAAAILVAVLLAFGSGAGLVAASADTVPGDTLYSVKRLWEALILALSQLIGQADDARARIAHNRLFEIEVLDEQGQLTESAMIELYSAIYELTLHRNADNNGAILAFMGQVRDALAQMTPAPAAQGVYNDLMLLAVTNVDTGGLQIPLNPLPQSILEQTATSTPTSGASSVPSSTPTPTLTPTSAATETTTPQATSTPSATATTTPRIPATPTRTPTNTPSPTLTPTLTLTPSASWTPIPLPGALSTTPASTRPVPGALPTSTPLPVLTDDSGGFVRATQQSVYMTQTAQAQNPGQPTPGN